MFCSRTDTSSGKRRFWELRGEDASPTSFWHLAEQARAAAGQLLQWKSDADQDGNLLLKSVYVLTGTDSVSSRPRRCSQVLLLCGKVLIP